MPKRKVPADALSNDSAAQRRRTRSSGALLDTQPLFSPSKTRTRSKRSIAVESSHTIPATDAHDTSSLKENEVEDSGDADELNLTPSRMRHGRARRVVMHSVELTTSSKRYLRNSPQHDAISPAPFLRHHPPNHASGPFAPQPPSTPSKNHVASRTTLKAGALTIEPSQSTKATSPLRLPRALPTHLHPCLNAQKRAILAALQNPPDLCIKEQEQEEDGPLTNTIASQQLSDLLIGTVARDEGNSCLILGPRGSGKTRLVEHTMAVLPNRPIIIRLSGWTQLNDRFAMREIARQLTQQTGRSFLSDSDEGELDPNENIDDPFTNPSTVVSLPPPSHLPALISVLPTLSRPTIVVLDAFDLFALHARQSLLYCLLDTVQSCRAGNGNKGVAVIGITTRVDTINLLEKRVKSRFSGRMLRTAAPTELGIWIDAARKLLLSPIHNQHSDEWLPMWTASVDKFLADPNVMKTFHETFALFRDTRMLSQMMMKPILELCPSSPFPRPSQISSAASRPSFHSLTGLTYPSICLLIAAMHAQTAGHDTMTFEMLRETFREQVRSSTSAPVQVEGGGIGMVRCTGDVLRSAFEMLVVSKMFVATAMPSTTMASAFVRYRCVIQRGDVKKATEEMGQTNLKKWLSKAQ